ncbi:MAG: hypothetical protein QOI59_3364 [Gammaproteobacteria bacterium]|nr:hypothetical protein [Gammaproteobacteria bacterium]
MNPGATVAVTGRLTAARRAWRLPPAVVVAIVLLVLLYSGWRFPTERYITPQRGIGYALGILGGSMMLLLFMYSARKRLRWLSFLGPTVNWFRFHMLLGLGGPLCILYHANFHLGATNSNVALISMLTVAGSGVIGRYIYSRIHHGVYGSKVTLTELRSGSENLQAVSRSVAFIPELVQRLESAERRLLAAGSRIPMLGLARPFMAAALALHSRLTLHRYIRGALRAAARNSSVIAAQRTRLRRTAFAYVDRRITATRRLADFQAFERLFSLWHALHIPLIVMLLVAGFVHVIVVHLY